MEAYEVRDSPRRSAWPVVTLLGSAVVPAFIAFLIWTARDDLSVMPLIGFGLGFTGIVMAGLAVGLVVFAVARLRGGLRRTLIVGVDQRGIVLGRAMLEGRRRFLSWDQVSGLAFYTTCSRSGVGEDPPLTYISYLQVDLRDGTADRRSAPDGRDPWGDVADAVGRLAPAVPIDFQGVLSENEDPFT